MAEIKFGSVYSESSSTNSGMFGMQQVLINASIGIRSSLMVISAYYVKTFS
jgi:hypothetical protein